jgi:EF-P beta-lysylation protein EpmB
LESEPWQQQLASAISDPAELLRLLGLAPGDLPGGVDSRSPFALRVPRYYAGLMRHGDPTDPLLAQVLPSARERGAVAGFGTDPVGDLAAVQRQGVLKKYHGRALLITTGACAVHCRYCFRRHFPYAGQSAIRNWREALEGVRQMPDVSELILSGGDPLALSDRRLAELLAEAEAIPQLRRLRIHTRLPVVLPARVTARFAGLIAGTRLRSAIVIHANHPREITPELRQALQPLKAAGAQLLNQAVLLKSVNDDADTLTALSESLFDIGVLPYYLHLLDPVAGAAHFEVSAADAQVLEDALWARLPGFLVPRMVREVPGAAGKSPLSRL